jgi:hypothetical protein
LVDATSSMDFELDTNGGDDWGNNLHLAIRDGSAWYISEFTFPVTAGTIHVGLSDIGWTLLTPSTASSSSLMTVAGASFGPRSFGVITAVGLFVDNRPAGTTRDIDYFGLNNTTYLTPFEQWTDSYGIYNEKAASDADPDNDAVDNLNEWAFGGNPGNSNDTGITERRFAVNTGEGNVVYVYPRLKSNPRPTYTLKETGGLVYGPWINNEGAYTITAGETWPNEPDFEAVTNQVPTGASVKFLKLEVSE